MFGRMYSEASKEHFFFFEEQEVFLNDA